MHKGIDDNDSKNVLPKNFLFAVQKAVATPVSTAIKVDNKACVNVKSEMCITLETMKRFDDFEYTVKIGAMALIKHITISAHTNKNKAIAPETGMRFIIRFSLALFIIAFYSERRLIISVTAFSVVLTSAESVFCGIGAAIL